MKQPNGQILSIDLTEGYNPGRFPALNNATCFNLFEFDGAMIPTAGYESILSQLSSENGESRGIFYSSTLKKMIVVLGSIVYAITMTSYQLLGRLNSLTGKVYIEENGLTTEPVDSDPGGQIAFSDGVHIYIWTLDGSFVKATNEFGNVLSFTPGTLTFQNSFFFVNDLDSNKIHVSSINNAKVFPENGYSIISERTISCIGFKNLLYVLGTERTYPFYGNAQNEFFPYSQDLSRCWEYGCISAATLANCLGIMVFLATSGCSNPTIVASTGGDPVPISTPGIDSIINNLSTPGDSEGFMYFQDGHIFYQINFYTDNLSLLYDFYTKKWTRVSGKKQDEVYPIRNVAYFENGNTIFGIFRYKQGIVNFSLNIYTDDGEIIPRTIITKNYSFQERQTIMKELDLQIEQGENQNTSKILISISKDNGRTFPINRVYQLGNIGQRKNLIRWMKLGSARWWTFKYDFYSIDRFVILNSTGYIQ